MPNSTSVSLDLPVDVPRLTGKNYIQVNLLKDGPSISGSIWITSKTGIIPLANPIVYSNTTYGFAISATMNTTGSVDFTAVRLEGYKPMDNVSKAVMPITLISKGSSEWESGSNTFSIVLLLRGIDSTGKPVIIPSPLSADTPTELYVSGGTKYILDSKTWSPIPAETEVNRYKTTDIFHTGKNNSSVYFKHHTTGSHMFSGKPKTPESLLTVANHVNDGPKIVPIVIKDTRRYTDQEQCICVVPHAGISQAVADAGCVTLVDISCEHSSSSDRLYGNGNTLQITEGTGSSDSRTYMYSQDYGTEPSYVCNCPNRDINGNCKSQQGCTYKWGEDLAAGKWTIYKGKSKKSNAVGITWKDLNPPCSGWSNGAVVTCSPSFLYSDDTGSSIYEEKAKMRILWYEQGNILPEYSTNFLITYECKEHSDSHTYYQKREHYSKTFPLWPGQYGRSSSYKEASAEILTRNSAGIYAEGMLIAPIDKADDISDKINSDIGVGLMCVKPSWHHKDMAVVVGNDACASPVGSTWAITAANKAGWPAAGAFLSPYNSLVRYITPFERKQLVSTATISGLPIPIMSASAQKCMEYYYKEAIECKGAILVQTQNGYATRNPWGGKVGKYSYTIDSDITIDAELVDPGSQVTTMDLDMHSGTGASADGIQSLMGCDTVEFEGGVYYNLNKYSVKMEQDAKYTDKEKIPCTPVECPTDPPEDPEDPEDPESGECPSGCSRIEFTPGTTFDVKLLYYTYLSKSSEDLGADADIPDNWSTVYTLEAKCSVSDHADVVFNKATAVHKTRKYDYDANGDIKWGATIHDDKYTTPDVSCEVSLHFYGMLFQVVIDDGDDLLFDIIADACCAIDSSCDFYDDKYETISCNGKTYLAGCFAKSNTTESNSSTDNYTPHYYNYSKVYNVRNSCDESSSSSSSESSSSCVPKSCDDHCYYRISTWGNADKSYSINVDVPDDPYKLDSITSSGIIRSSLVYPFEGPDINGKRYRSIMYAHSTALSEGSIKLTKATVNESDSGYWSSDDPNEGITLSYGDKTSTMMPGSHYILDREMQFPGCVCVGKELVPISHNLDNKYDFNLSYDVSSSSSSSSSSAPLAPSSCSFIAIYYNKHMTGSSYMKKGESSKLGLPEESGTISVDVIKYVFPGDSDSSVSYDNSDGTVVRYEGHIKATISDTTITLGDPTVLGSDITIEKAIAGIMDVTNTYRGKETSISGDNTSYTCPTYRYAYDEIRVLCTYTTDTNTLTSSDLISMASNGLSSDFFTQVTDGSLPDEMQDILSAGVPGSYTSNTKYTIIKRRCK